VVGTAGPATAVALDGFPFTVTDVEIRAVVAGHPPPGHVQVLQLGSADVDSPDTAPLLVAGRTYLLFLSVDTAGRYAVTGGEGVYAATADPQVFAYAGGPGGRLPATVELASVAPTQKPIALGNGVPAETNRAETAPVGRCQGVPSTYDPEVPWSGRWKFIHRFHP
jgi:hypothetical protein